MLWMQEIGRLSAQLVILVFTIFPTTPVRLVVQATPVVSPTLAFPSFNPDFPPPPNWTGPTFALSQNYPTSLPQPEENPWEKIDFKQQPLAYLRSVLAYALEGNPAVDFDVQKNSLRTWYHTPWLHTGCFGREFMHGLTRERSSRPRELSPNQTGFVDNWAVGFYNPPGGYTVGQVWRTPSGVPDPAKAVFPVGTVAFKLLFTTALTTEVPFLSGTLEWEANIYPRLGSNPCPANQPPAARQNQTVRLLQVDVAVRDSRAGQTGWVFGTFMYNATAPGATVWDRLVPVGLTWGNDPTVKTDLNRTGAFINPDLTETVINALLITQPQTVTQQTSVMHLGLGGRLNGPIDNPASSCMSCHGRASYPDQPLVPANAAPATYTTSNLAIFFANVPFGAQQITTPRGLGRALDYSLQLAAGLEAYCRVSHCNTMLQTDGLTLTVETPPETALASKSLQASAMLPNVSREGNAELASQLAVPETPARLPVTGGSSSSLIFPLALAVLTLLIGLLLYWKNEREAHKQEHP